MENKIVNRCLFLIIILLQVSIFIFWAEKKGNYYWDEYFTFLRARDISMPINSDVYPSYNPEYEYNCWTDNQNMVSEFIVLKDETTVLDDGIYNIIKQVLHNPYPFLLNISETFFFSGEINKWAGISWNILLFVIIQLVMCCITKDMGLSRTESIFAMCIYGFSGMAVSMVTFVRQYMFSTLFSLIIIYIYIHLIQEDRIIKELLYVSIANAILLWIFFTNPLVGILFGGLVIGYIFVLIKEKKIRKLIYYLLPNFIMASVSLLFSERIRMTLFPSTETIVEKSTASAVLINNLLNLDCAAIIARLKTLLYQIYIYQFGDKSTAILLFVSGIALFFGGTYFKKKSDIIFTKKYYISMLSILLLFFLMMGVFLDFVVIERYISIVFPVLAIVLAHLIYEITYYLGSKQLCFISFFVILIVISTNFEHKYAYLYIEDKEVTDKIKELANIDYFYVDTEHIWTIDEALVWSKEYNNRYLRKANCLPDYNDFPLEFVAWFYDYQGNCFDENIDKIKDAGYEVGYIGNTYISKIVLCSKV